MMPIDAALGFALLDIKVAFEIVVLCLFREFSKRAQADRNLAVGRPMPFAREDKINMGAGEIDPGGISHVAEVWW